MTNLSDLILDEEDEDIKSILNATQSDSSQSNLATNRVTSSSSLKRTRRTSKSLPTSHEKNNEFIFDEEHLIELLKRLKQQQQPSDDESNLFETLISKSFISRNHIVHLCL